jgi:hypothetical protein
MFSPISASSPSGHAVHSGNGTKPCDFTLERAQSLLDLLLDPSHLRLHEVEMVEQFAQQKSMMRGNASFEGPLQLWNLVAQQSPRHLSEPLAVPFAIHDRFSKLAKFLKRALRLTAQATVRCAQRRPGHIRTRAPIAPE